MQPPDNPRPGGFGGKFDSLARVCTRPGLRRHSVSWLPGARPQRQPPLYVGATVLKRRIRRRDPEPEPT